MIKIVLAALLFAAPATAFAQSNTSTGSTSAARPAPSGNLNNPQAQANQAGQPANARSLPSSGDATAVPTPTLPGGWSQVPQQPEPPQSSAIR